MTTTARFLALFDSPGRAVRCAAAALRAVDDLGISVRAGLHTGEVELLGGNVRGLAVHVAARIMSLGGPGDVLESGTTIEVLDGSGLVFESRGTRELKGVTGGRAVYALAR